MIPALIIGAILIVVARILWAAIGPDIVGSAERPIEIDDPGNVAHFDIVCALMAIEHLVRQDEASGPAMDAVLEDLDAARLRLRAARAPANAREAKR